MLERANYENCDDEVFDVHMYMKTHSQPLISPSLYLSIFPSSSPSKCIWETIPWISFVQLIIDRFQPKWRYTAAYNAIRCITPCQIENEIHQRYVLPWRICMHIDRCDLLTYDLTSETNNDWINKWMFIEDVDFFIIKLNWYSNHVFFFWQLFRVVFRTVVVFISDANGWNNIHAKRIHWTTFFSWPRPRELNKSITVGPAYHDALLTKVQWLLCYRVGMFYPVCIIYCIYRDKPFMEGCFLHSKSQWFVNHSSKSFSVKERNPIYWTIRKTFRKMSKAGECGIGQQRNFMWCLLRQFSFVGNHPRSLGLEKNWYEKWNFGISWKECRA